MDSNYCLVALVIVILTVRPKHLQTLNAEIDTKISFQSCTFITLVPRHAFFLYVEILMHPPPAVIQHIYTCLFFQKSVLTSTGSKQSS